MKPRHLHLAHSTQVELSPDLYSKLQSLAEFRGTNINTLVHHALALQFGTAFEDLDSTIPDAASEHLSFDELNDVL